MSPLSVQAHLCTQTFEARRSPAPRPVHPTPTRCFAAATPSPTSTQHWTSTSIPAWTPIITQSFLPPQVCLLVYYLLCPSIVLWLFYSLFAKLIKMQPAAHRSSASEEGSNKVQIMRDCTYVDFSHKHLYFLLLIFSKQAFYSILGLGSFSITLFYVIVAAFPPSKKHISCTADVARQTKTEKKTWTGRKHM